MTPCFLYASPLKKNKNCPLTTCCMPSSLISLPLPIQSTNEGARVCAHVHFRCGSICHLICVFSGGTVGVHLLFWLAGLPACIRLPGSRCQTHYSKSFNLPCIYKCAHLAWGPVHCSWGSQSNLCPVHQRGSCPSFGLGVCLCVSVCV